MARKKKVYMECNSARTAYQTKNGNCNEVASAKMTAPYNHYNSQLQINTVTNERTVAVLIQVPTRYVLFNMYPYDTCFSCAYIHQLSRDSMSIKTCCTEIQ